MERDKQAAHLTDFVILTALPKERDAVLRYLPSPERTVVNGRNFYKASLRGYKGANSQVILLSLPDMGNINAALATHNAIAVWNPTYIVLGGIAGGVQNKGDRCLGDVIVGEQIIYYEYGKQTAGGITRRYQAYRPAQPLISAARNLAHKTWSMSIKATRPDGSSTRVIPRVHFGVVASGEKVVTDTELIEELRTDWSQLVGIEMEGAGSALAAYDYGTTPGVLLVKGISDWANAQKEDGWQEYAAEASASFITELLRSESFADKPKLQPERNDRKRNYAGKVKISVCRRLLRDWEDLADYFEIPLQHRARFPLGREPHGVWEWLEQRNKLYALEDALETIERHDLVLELM